MDKRRNERRNEITRELTLQDYINTLRNREEMWERQYKRARSKDNRRQLLQIIEELQFIRHFIEFIKARYFSREFLQKMFLTRITGKAEAHKYFGRLMTFMDELRMQEW
jgi:hypothetical protein